MVNSRDSIPTKRERDVLALAGRGLTNQEIADELFISTLTVKCTLHRACVRLGARNRTQAVILAMRRGALHILDMFSTDDLAELLASLPPELMASVCQRVEQNHMQNRLPSSTAGYESGNKDSKDKVAGGVECVC
ncbi:MAG: helix-turn-helix transcriptional regulator [Dehalococcoidia bacterium]